MVVLFPMLNPKKMMGAYKIEKIHVDVCQKHLDEWASKLKKFRMVKAMLRRC